VKKYGTYTCPASRGSPKTIIDLDALAADPVLNLNFTERGLNVVEWLGQAAKTTSHWSNFHASTAGVVVHLTQLVSPDHWHYHPLYLLHLRLSIEIGMQRKEMTGEPTADFLRLMGLMRLSLIRS
jgi:hypothetical protein